ncbi:MULTISPECIES: hypothetical protein [unclassified Endozoicomonas]|uniref:hypothetical protein n=1 Tax=unclassified Endozoicomonas TaxID=2644528 RepID=UPI003BB5EB57
MKALPTPGLAQPTNKLPTLEKQYKESWFYAFLRNIKLEEAAPKKRNTGYRSQLFTKPC